MYSEPFCQIRSCTVASARASSPFNTANTTWICSSPDTCRDGFCDLLTQTPFVTGQPRPLPQSLTHSSFVVSNVCSIFVSGVP